VVGSEGGVETVRAKVEVGAAGRAFLRIRDLRPAFAGITSLATQPSATPVLTHQIGPDRTAVRVWTGETPFTEPFFTLFVNRGGSVTKIRMTRWESRVINLEPGSSVGFGTSDGRPVHLMADAPPAHLATTFAITGTANCDRAGVPLWAPTAAHLTLPENARAFEIASDGIERIVFISESDGLSWSPPRWLRVPKSGGVRVHATCAQVALANYAGDPLTINAPDGSIIGGTAATMHLPMPAVTGTSRDVENVAELKLAIAAAVAGDEIVLADGIYPLDVNLTAASFTANQSAGRIGMEGILIRSASGDRSTCTLTCASGNVGDWALTQTGASLLSGFHGITFDFSGTTAAHFTLNRGRYALEACRFTGVNTNINTFDFAGDGTAAGLVLDVLRCQFDTGGGDLISGNNTSGTACAVRIIDCVAFGTGVAESHQCVTTHGQGIPLQVFGGNYHSAQLNAFAPGTGGGTNGRIYWFFGMTSDVSRSCKVQGTDLFGCSLARSAAVGLASNYEMAWIATVIRAGFSEHVAKSGLVEGCLFQRAGTGSYGMQLYASTQTSSTLRFNVVAGFGEGIRMSDSNAGATGTSTVAHTAVVDCAVGIRASDSRLGFVLTHLATKGSTTGLATTADAVSRMTRSYNTLDPAVSGFYSLGAGDLTNTDAALDSRFFPLAAGNCDGNGDPAATAWVGGTDFEGYPLRLATSVIDRGARCRPRIIPAAELFPDLW
jgi:hypothetical protein